MALVTVAQVNQALRLGLNLEAGPGNERYDDVVMKLNQAEDICLDYITVPEKAGWTAENVPGRVQAAIILTVRALLDDSEDSAAWLSGIGNGMTNDVRNPITALLRRLRDPAVA